MLFNVVNEKGLGRLQFLRPSPTPARQPHTDLPAFGESEIGRTGGSIWCVVGLRSPAISSN
jgi:hypothetical protein